MSPHSITKYLLTQSPTWCFGCSSLTSACEGQLDFEDDYCDTATGGGDDLFWSYPYEGGEFSSSLGSLHHCDFTQLQVEVARVQPPSCRTTCRINHAVVFLPVCIFPLSLRSSKPKFRGTPPLFPRVSSCQFLLCTYCTGNSVGFSSRSLDFYNITTSWITVIGGPVGFMYV